MSRLYGPGVAQDMAVGPMSGTTWSPITIMAITRRAADNAIDALLSINTSGNSTVGHVGIYSNNDMLYNHQGVQFTTAVGMQSLAADGWCLLAWTHTGSAAPIMYKGTLATGALVSGTASNAVGPMNTPGVGGFWTIAGNSFFEPYNGDIAAVCAIERVLSEAEIRSAMRGDWWRFTPTMHDEKKLGRDNLGMGRGLGRDSQRTVTQLGAQRSLADPPGFRFSALLQRR